MITVGMVLEAQCDYCHSKDGFVITVRPFMVEYDLCAVGMCLNCSHPEILKIAEVRIDGDLN